MPELEDIADWLGVVWDALVWLLSSELLWGAVLAGLVGLCTQWLHRRRETQARRKALLQTLNDQLMALPETGHTIIAGVNFRTVWPVTAIAPLLAGDVLDAGKHGQLLKALVKLQDDLAQYNAFVATRNLIWGQAIGQTAQAWDKAATIWYPDLRNQALRVLDLMGQNPTPPQHQSSGKSPESAIDQPGATNQ